MEAKVDMAKLRKSMKYWRRRFGETNRDSVARLAGFMARELAIKTQPYGTKKSAREALQQGVRKDYMVSCRQVDDGYFNKLKRQSSPTVMLDGRWTRISGKQILSKPDDVVDHVNSLRGADGKVDRGKIGPQTIGVTTEKILEKAERKAFRRVGLTKGAWLVAGRKAAKFATGKAAVSTRGWPGSVAEKSSGSGKAKAGGPSWRPFMAITNRMRQTRSSRFLRRGDIRKAFVSAYRKQLNQYRAAVRRMDKERGR